MFESRKATNLGESKLYSKCLFECRTLEKQNGNKANNLLLVV